MENGAMENGEESQEETQVDEVALQETQVEGIFSFRKKRVIHHGSQADAEPVEPIQKKKKCLEVLPPLPTKLKAHDLYYSMKRPEKGLAIIFNHESYDEIDGRVPEEREGTNEDVNELHTTLSHLGFLVEIRNNLTYKEVMDYISDVSKSEDLEYHDCLIVIVLTHGSTHERICARDKYYYIKDLVEPFIEGNCLQLSNKPKLFFIQACKGPEAQSKIVLRTMTDSTRIEDFEKKSSIYSIPADSDVLIAYATLEGYIALRDELSGAPYIQCLCHELKENGTELDLLSILIRVHNRLATSTFVLKGSPQHIKVQPSFLCYLNRFVKFDAPAVTTAQTQ